MNEETSKLQAFDPAAIIAQYLKLRAKCDEIMDKANEACKPFSDAMKLLEGWLTGYYEQNNLRSLRTDAGTAYMRTNTRTTVVNRDAFKEFCENGHWELAVIAADKEATETYMEEHRGQLPPGVEVSRSKALVIRRS